MHIYARLMKVDEATRMVYGRAVAEEVDKAQEVFDYASSKPYFEAWSSEFAKNTDGKSVGNVRAMHGKVAAGVLKELHFVDDEKAIDVAAHVVDDNEWNKCLQGVYTGFSIGGSYVRKWDDAATGAKRYTAKPSELSLVDAPCVPTARFTVVKADGAEVEQEFAAAEGLLKQVWQCGIPEHSHVQKDEARSCIEEQAQDRVAKAVEDDLSGYVDEGDSPDADDAAAVEAEKADGNGKVGKTVNGKSYPASDWAYVPDPSKPSTWKLRLTAEPGGEPTSRLVAGCVAALGKGFRGNKVEIPAKDLPKVKAKVRAAWKKVHKGDGSKMPDVLKVAAGDLQKGMYGVGRLADILQALNYLAEDQQFEEQAEGDGSKMSSKLKTVVGTLGDLLVQMATEETDELTAGDDVEVLALSETGDIEKIAVNAERYPALTKAIQFYQAKPTGDGSGADTAAEETMNEEAVTKLLSERDEKITQQAEKIEKQEGTIKSQGEAIEALTKQVKEIGERAAPGKGRLRVIGKVDDAGDGEEVNQEDAERQLAEKLDNMEPGERSKFLMRLALRDPTVVAAE